MTIDQLTIDQLAIDHASLQLPGMQVQRVGLFVDITSLPSLCLEF